MNLPTSIKYILEEAIRKSYEDQLNEALKTIEKTARDDLDKKLNSIKLELKKEANKMALEMLQKVNTTGISIELKL